MNKELLSSGGVLAADEPQTMGSSSNENARLLECLDGDVLGSLSECLIDTLINEIGGMQFSTCVCPLAISVTKTTGASCTKTQPRIVNAKI